MIADALEPNGPAERDPEPASSGADRLARLELYAASLPVQGVGRNDPASDRWSEIAAHLALAVARLVRARELADAITSKLQSGVTARGGLL